MNETNKSRDKLWTLIKDIKFAMFTTRHGNGHLHARPMTTQNKALEEDDSLWFFMSKKGDPVDDLKTDPVVNVVYADPSSDTYVSVSGTAAMIEDAVRCCQRSLNPWPARPATSSHGDAVIAAAATTTNANVTLLSTAMTFGRPSATAKPT